MSRARRPRPGAGGAPRSEPSPRRIALDALVRVEGGAYSNLDLPVRLRRSRLGPRERAWVTDAVYATLRGQARIDALVAPHSARPLAALDPPVRAALRLGTFQLLRGVAAHAAVGETVAAAPPGARRYVNGVLRALARTGPPFREPDDLALRLSYPGWIVDELIARVGAADAVASLEAMNVPPAVTLRVHTRRGSAAALSDELSRAGASVTAGVLAPDALRVQGAGDIGALRAVREGRVTPQDEASQAVVAALDPRPGERVLDLAAAPGGKATAIAEAQDDRGLVVAADLHGGRLGRVRDAAGRLRLASVHVVAADGTAPPWRSGAFDRVLVDAPCSGLGVLRRRAEARWRCDPDAIAGLVALQRRLLDAAAGLVRPGGRLVYSVCTLTAAETGGIDDWLRSRHPELEAIAPPEPPWRPDGRGALLLPHDAGTDGMYLAAYERAR